MMVTAVMDAGEGESSFQTVLGKLQGKQDGGASQDRAGAYDDISNWFKENDAAKIKNSENLDMSVLIHQFSTDVMSDDTTLVQAALPAMGFCLNQAGIVRAFTDEECSLVVKALCNCLLKTDDKSLCTRALWCLAKQNIKPDIIKEEIHTILCSVEKAVQGEGSAKSMTVQHESINVIIRLQEQLPEAMSHHAARWGKLLLPHLVHSAPRIRDRAVHATHLGLVAIVQARAELVGTLVADLKSTLLTEMIKLFRARNEMLMLRVWTYYVTILGKTLHKGGSLINNLLTVIELGFKNPQPEVKKAAYKSWHALIDNFSLDIDVLGNAKRLKLLMQPFLATSIRYESVVHAKLDAWWHLIRSLGPRLPSTFQVVCAPLLQCTLGSIRTGATGVVTPNKSGTPAPPFMPGFSTPQTRTALLPATSPITPRLNLSALNGSGAQQVFSSVQLRGVRMLAAILGIQEPPKEGSAAIDTLPQRLLSSPSVFSKVASSLVPFVMEVFFLQDETIGDLPLRIFQEFVEQVRGVVEGSTKRDSVAVFALFMEHLTTLVNSNQLPPSTVLKLLDSVSQLPKKVLSSSSYHTGSAGVMHGTPALFLTNLLFNQTTIVSQPEERFFSILIRLVECGMASPGTFLGFSQSVIAIVDKVSDSVTNKDTLWRMWSVLASPLLQHIVQANDVNQGDSLEHDFSAVTACLLFPVQRLLTANLTQSTVKTLLKLWSELYEAFARSASKVAIAEANQCCEDVSCKLLTQIDGGALEKWCYVDAVSQVCRVITQNLDLSHYTTTTPGSPRHPGKRPKVKSRYQGNLTSLVKLVAHVTEACADLCKKQTTLFSPSLSQTDVVYWFSAAQSLIGAMSDCCRVGLPSYIHGILINWSKPLGHFIHFVASPNIAKKDYLSAIEDKLERLWIDLTTTVQNRYSSGFDSAFLNVMAPALEAVFTHKKRSLRNYTLIFWTATFGNQDSLQYPEILKPCLSKIRTIGEISLPGWAEEDIIGETPVIPETEDPDDDMAPPAPPAIPNFGAPSPQKMHGSFLHRLDDAKKLLAASSPVKASHMTSPGRGKRIQTYSPGSTKRKQFASPMATDAAKRRLHVDEDKNTAFVVISSEPKKKRVLTEHQKEVMRTKRVSLALYNGLDQSQDTQAFKDFSQTQSQSQTSSPLPTPEIEDLADEPRKFNFSRTTGQNQPEVKEVEKERMTEDVKEVEEEEESVVVLPSSQEKSLKPTRRVVTFFEPVKKLSSPIKDAGQILVEDATDFIGDHSKDVDSSHERIGMDSVRDLAEVGKESSVVIVEDTCQDISQEELGLLSSGVFKDVGEADEEERNKEFDVPETQEDPGVHDVSDDFVPVVVGESPVKYEVIPESYVESPSKDDDLAVQIEESPVRDELLDAEDLMDVLPDGRFKKVISTPIIKLQKLSQRDIELYSPRGPKYGDKHTTQELSPHEKHQGNALAGISDATSPKMQSPEQSSPSSLSGTPRLRRYRSDEIHNRKGTPKSTRRSNSVSESSSPKSKASPTKKATDLKILQASQQDLADLAERYELDGIAPLGDDLDQTIEECLAKINYGDNDDNDLPAVDYGQKGDTALTELKEMADHGGDEEMPEENVLCSQQELFSNTMDSSTMDETVIEIKPHSVEELPEKDVDETIESTELSSQNATTRRRGRPRKSQNKIDEDAESQDGSVQEGTSQDSASTESENIQQVKKRRGRPKLSQNAENQGSESLDKNSVEEMKDVGRRRRRSRKTLDNEDVESQASESGEKENEDVKSKRGSNQKTACVVDGDSELVRSRSQAIEEGKKSEKKSGRHRKGDAKLCSLDETDQETESEVLDTGRKRRRPKKFGQNYEDSQKQQTKIDEDSQKQQTKIDEDSQKQETKIDEDIATIGIKRRRSRKSDICIDQKASSQDDQIDIPEIKAEDTTESLAEDTHLCVEQNIEEEMSEKEEVIQEGSKNKALPEAEMTAPNSEAAPEANSSSEDLFGTCASQGQKETLSKDCQDAVEAQLNESIESEDDDIPLVQIRASLQAKANVDVKLAEINDAGNLSEDSEVDFPIMTPGSREEKVSPTTETPPRDQVAEVLTRIKEKDTPKREVSTVKDDEILTVTRSGRKCRPSSKIRCAKDILRKALMSPDGRHKNSKPKSGEPLKSPTRISPKALRTKAKNITTIETSPINGKNKHKRRSHSPEKKGALGTKQAETATSLTKKDVSSYAISPRSLKTLAEKVAQDLFPKPKLSPPKVMSARRSRPLSPKTSTLSSSQIMRNVRSGRVSKRSKSPVSLRLRSKKLCLSSGPLQTRAGTKLSRMEIKKRNKKQKEQLDLSQKRMDNVDDTADVTEPIEKNDDDSDDTVARHAEEVIVIKDTMSQEMDEDITQIKQDAVEEELGKGTEQIINEERRDDGNSGDECVSKGTEQIINEERKDDGNSGDECVSSNFSASMEAVDEDGDIEMRDLEQGMSQASEIPEINEGAPQEPQVQEAENVAEFELIRVGEQSNSVEASAVQNPPVLEEHLADRIAIEQDIKIDHPEKKDDGIKQSDAIRMKTRTKRSSQRLTFGEEGESEGEQTSEKDGIDLTEAKKVEEVNMKEDENKSESDDDGDEDVASSGSEESEEEEQAMEEEDEMEGFPESANLTVKDGDIQKIEGTPIGVVSSGLDVQDTEEDIINSSQSPLKPIFEGDDEQQDQTTDSPSQRLTFPNLSPPEMENLASPEKPKMTAVTMDTMQSLQVSPIIPTKFNPRMQGSPEGASMRPIWPNQLDSPEGSIPHMYSPNTSPSSGILKHRDVLGCSSPSPSSKSRRVSFADKVFIEPEPLQDHSAVTKVPKIPDSSLSHGLAQDSSRGRLPMSPLVTTASSKVLAHSSKYITTPSKSDLIQSSSSSPSSSPSSSSTLHRLRRKSPHSSRRMKAKPLKSFPNMKTSTYASKVFSMVNQNQESTKRPVVPSQSTQGSLTQGSPSTQVDSSLEAQGESQGSVYPALTECSLPVENVLPRLTSSMWSRGLGQLVRARNIRTIGDLSSLSPMQVLSLPIKSPKVSHLKNVLSAFRTEKFPESKGTDVDSNSSTNDNGSSTPPGRPAGQRSNHVASEGTSKDSGSLSPPRSPQAIHGNGLLGRLEALVSDFREGALDALPAAELFQAHQHVNNLTDIIMDALKVKCHSPSMTKDDN